MFFTPAFFPGWDLEGDIKSAASAASPTESCDGNLITASRSLLPKYRLETTVEQYKKYLLTICLQLFQIFSSRWGGCAEAAWIAASGARSDFSVGRLPDLNLQDLRLSVNFVCLILTLFVGQCWPVSSQGQVGC